MTHTGPRSGTEGTVPSLHGTGIVLSMGMELGPELGLREQLEGPRLPLWGPQSLESLHPSIPNSSMNPCIPAGRRQSSALHPLPALPPAVPAPVGITEAPFCLWEFWGSILLWAWLFPKCRWHSGAAPSRDVGTGPVHAGTFPKCAGDIPLGATPMQLCPSLGWDFGNSQCPGGSGD